MIRVCGIPLRGDHFGGLFGLKSLAVLGVRGQVYRTGDKDLRKALDTLLAAVKDEYCLTQQSFPNLDVAAF